MPVIDVCGFVPEPGAVRGLIRDWIGFRGYTELFAANVQSAFGIPGDEFAQLRATYDDAALADVLVERATPLLTDATAFLGVLDAADVQTACLFTHDDETTTGVTPDPPDALAAVCAAHPDRYLGFIGVDPHKGAEAVATLDRAVTELGYRGAVTAPFRSGIYANDPLWRPIYEACIRHDIPVWIHTSNNWSREHAMDFGRPLYLDKVAVRYPDLKIIAGHGGWPWVQEMVAVAWRHPNVYIDPSAHNYRYFTRPGSGWEPLLHFGNTTIKHKVVFGSEWLLLGTPLPGVVESVRALPLKDDVKDLWLYENAARLLNLQRAPA